MIVAEDGIPFTTLCNEIIIHSIIITEISKNSLFQMTASNLLHDMEVLVIGV